MNVEVFSYSGVVAVLGMAVVFGFLWFLSLLMSVTKMLFDDRPAKTATAKAGKVESTSTPDSSIPKWAIAAVAAYVIEKELEGQRSAEAWDPNANPVHDAWTAAPRF